MFTALLLASPFVTAGTQYPAADFQPKVVYQDTEYQHQGSESSSSVTSAPLGEKAQADSNYPAATFQPEVLYQDTEYKHDDRGITSAAASSTSVATSTGSTSTKGSSSVDDGVVSEEASMNPLFAIVVLAVAGFLYSKKTKGTTKPKKRMAASRSRVLAAGSDGADLTGVAKYLAEKSPSLTGVAKYLEQSNASPKSGVAKYVAKKVVAAKKMSSKKVTGVEKYMRSKG